MCIRLNNINQLKEILKHFYQRSNTIIHKQYNQIIKANKFKQTTSAASHVKFEAYKSRVTFKATEQKIETIQNGLLRLLVFRVSDERII